MKVIKMYEWKYQIAESSALFQGHEEQIFSKKKLGFKISSIYEDNNKIQKINVEHYRKFFATDINKLLGKREKEGYDCTKIIDVNRDMELIYPKFISNDPKDSSGVFSLYPLTAICSHCHKYIRLNKPTDKCNCNAKLLQFTFVAFCDTCGANYPIHTMSNIFNDCTKCNSKNSLRKINWEKKDDINTYAVTCTQCGNTEKLVLYMCDHTNHQTKQIRSSSKKTKFRAVAVRSGSILHPMVSTLPNIPYIADYDNIANNLFSVSFNYLFKNINNIDESLLFVPEFEEILKHDKSFFTKKMVERELTDNKEDKLPDPFNSNTMDMIKFITGLIEEAYNKIQKYPGKEKIWRDNFGINNIEECLHTLSNMTHGDNKEQQGLFLLKAEDSPGNNHNLEIKVKSVNSEADDYNYLQNFGIEKIGKISNLNMIQALIGVIEGSTRNNTLLFRTITNGNNGRIRVFVRNIPTEGLYFKLDSAKIIRWLVDNNIIDRSNSKYTDKDKNANDARLRKLVNSEESIRNTLYTLLHTFSHTLIQNASIYTGLDTQSMSEMIFPSLGLFLLYSTNPVNVGGLEYTFDNMLEEWLKNVKELAQDCPQDPACMIDEGGSCNACLYLPEFVCENFNTGLDRATLIGYSKRYITGFLNE